MCGLAAKLSQLLENDSVALWYLEPYKRKSFDINRRKTTALQFIVT